MKTKKGFSLLLLIPLVVLVLVIGGVFTYKLFSDGTKAKASEIPVVKTIPPLSGESGKPSTGYGSIIGPTSTPTVTSTVPVVSSIPTSTVSNISIETIVTEDPQDSGANFSDVDVSIEQL